MDRGSWHLMMANLEFLAGGWELAGDVGPAEDMRTALIAYLEPELPVRYFYAGEWRVGTLLVHPPKDRGHWQIQREDAGAMVDRVPASSERIRVYVEGTKPPTTSPPH